VLALAGALLWRRRRQVAVLTLAATGAVLSTGASAADALASASNDRWYLGADLALTRLEPEDRGGGAPWRP
jgi:hypothetical protein